MRMSNELTVANVVQDTEDSVYITLHIPQEMREHYRYRPGQFITLEVEIEGAWYRRSYSICGSFAERESLSILVKRVPDGVVLNYLNSAIQAGMPHRIAPPAGRFTADPKLLRKRHHVFFAAGCGITPIMPMIEELMKKEKLSRATLFYASKN